MELLHMVTEFGDLYGAPASRSPTPGFYDEMDAADATHPSSFTKLKMGWLDTSSIDIASGTSTAETFVLHPLALLQPPPPGRTTAVRIPISGSSSHYFLVESRERLDDYDRGTNTLNAGIPGEGVVIFDVDETTWPPLWLKTSPALAAGAQFTDHTAQIEIIVDNPIAGGGFPISVRSTEPARCETIRAELESLVFEINDLQRELKKASPVEKPSIAGRIKAAQKLVTALKQEALSLHCRLQ